MLKEACRNLAISPLHVQPGLWAPKRVERRLLPQKFGANRHIVIVDDSRTHLVHLKALLSHIPLVTVDIFEHATADVLDFIELRANLVIIDHIMPDVSGIEFLRSLKARPNLKSLPTLMLTSAHDEQTRLSALMEGVTKFRTKPIDPYSLRKTVENLLPPM